MEFKRPDKWKKSLYYAKTMKKGFTLIELMIVVSGITLLISVAISIIIAVIWLAL